MARQSSVTPVTRRATRSRHFNQLREQLREGDLTCRYPAHSPRLWLALALTVVPFLTTFCLRTDKLLRTGAPAAAPQPNDDRHRDGIVIWETPADAKVPFLLRFNINTQLRYLNTLSSDETLHRPPRRCPRGSSTQRHHGQSRDVHLRRLHFRPEGAISFTVWTSAGAASIIVASNIGWQFNRALTVTGGYTGVPGSRSLVDTFPYFQAIDRTMSDNFFRPGFTQGAWANGELADEPALSGVRR